MPHEPDEFKLSYYNSNTMWISVDALLQVFGLTRGELGDDAKTALTGFRRPLVQRSSPPLTRPDADARLVCRRGAAFDSRCFAPLAEAMEAPRYVPWAITGRPAAQPGVRTGSGRCVTGEVTR